MTRNAISLFSSSGIGDLGLRANGINTVIENGNYAVYAEGEDGSIYEETGEYY